jgi:hypothetical protein
LSTLRIIGPASSKGIVDSVMLTRSCYLFFFKYLITVFVLFAQVANEVIMILQ